MERIYPRFALGAVGAVLVKEDRMLLVKRGSPPGRGLWSLPGGLIKPGERVGEAARRELREETGLDGEPLGVIYVLNNVVLDQEGSARYHYIILDVLFDPDSIKGELKAGSDALDAKWFSLPEILAGKGVSRIVLKLVHRMLSSGLSYIPLEYVENIVSESS
ncbi:MAG: NUDIX hydrolase [Desulfurococcus sp.]|nr:NUDIX hydrolase [Desulfurococcus sp.]